MTPSSSISLGLKETDSNSGENLSSLALATLGEPLGPEGQLGPILLRSASSIVRCDRGAMYSNLRDYQGQNRSFFKKICALHVPGHTVQ